MRETQSQWNQISVEELTNIVNKCNSIRQVLLCLGYNAIGANHKNLKEFLVEKNISIDHFKRQKTNNVFLCEKSLSTTTVVKRHILKNKLIKYQCSLCDIVDMWNNKKLVLVLDHINGINNDNRLENLRFLCPNCNSQQSTFAGRNVKKTKEININYINELSLMKEKQNILNNMETEKQRQNNIEKIMKTLSVSKNLSEASDMLEITDNGLRKRCFKYNINAAEIINQNKKNFYLSIKPQVINFYREHGNLEKTSAFFGISRSQVSILVREFINPIKKITEKDYKQFMYLYYEKKMKLSKISKILGFSTVSLRKFIIK